jgi:hypothetical protein
MNTDLLELLARQLGNVIANKMIKENNTGVLTNSNKYANINYNIKK